MLFVLTLDHIENAFLYLLSIWLWKVRPYVCSWQGRNVLEATKICQKKAYISEAKSPRKIIEQRVLEKKICLFADIFTYVSNCYRK